MATARLYKVFAVLSSIGLPGFASAVQGQQAIAPLASVQPAPEKTGPPAASDPDRPRLAERNQRYKINRSDVLNLSFPLSPELNQTVTVQPDGYITLQGAGSISILGMTVPETSEAIKKAYAKVLHEPIVDVDLKDFQRAYFIVTGQVTKPGQYDLRYDLTATQAIAIAGGFMPTAKTQVFLYHRASDGWVQARELKLKDFLHGKNVAEDVEIRPGDLIFVPEKTITKVRKYIPYSVGVPLSTTPVAY
jgi:polysaccharide biosynthesis/export protein